MVSSLNLKRSQNEAWKLYSSWRKEGGINCPAFKCKVQVTLKGWRHLIGSTGNKKRISADTYRRMRLLPHVKYIIENSKLIQNITKKHGRTFYVLEGMANVEENGSSGLRKIRVILIEDFKGNKIFLSIMDRK